MIIAKSGKKYPSVKGEVDLNEIRDEIANLLDIPNNQQEADKKKTNAFVKWGVTESKEEGRYYFDVFIWNGFSYESAHLDSYLHDDSNITNCYYEDITDMYHAMATAKQALYVSRIVLNSKGCR
jgi:hypothetical protein